MASAMETLCGQAFGAKKYYMLGIYLQRSWIVLFLCAIILLPIYFFATPILLLIGQAPDIAKQSGQLSIWFIPLHFSYVLLLPQQRFLQCQQRNLVNAAISAAALVLHVFISWLFMQKFHLGLVAAALTLNFSWWIVVIGQLGYIVFGGCPITWKGFSMEAFSDIWEFVKLSVASGVMLCLENWYYKVLILMGGYLKDAKTAVDALSVCQNINTREFMIPLAFFAGTGFMTVSVLHCLDRCKLARDQWKLVQDNIDTMILRLLKFADEQWKYYKPLLCKTEDVVLFLYQKEQLYTSVLIDTLPQAVP